jgi:ribonuclease HII
MARTQNARQNVSLTGLTRDHERGLFDNSLRIAGVDEVGRGPLAGPVVAAAVLFPLDLSDDDFPKGLGDSKKLSPIQRENAFEAILACAHVSIASLPASAIDESNIRLASLEAMRGACLGLSVTPDIVLVDGRDIPPLLPMPSKAIIKGDAHIASIAAASIVAKVMRDRMMVELAKAYPVYGFERHAGYGTAFHRDALLIYGPCPEHRFSFAPLKGNIFRKKGLSNLK